jgi:histidyl-tRNA synthetase
MQPLPGFRDFLPNDCAARNYIFARWREVARRYGFVEWDGPVLEPTDLYTKKSGPEIVTQLFNFTDKGEREVAMRPELTPTLARVVAAHEREFKKPIKWFSIGQFFRYEKQQRGRLREHYQLNCDIVGEADLSADGELIALAIDLLRSFGLTEDDFFVRISSREIWRSFLMNQRARPIGGFADAEAKQLRELLAVIDKMERQDDSVSDKLLSPLHVTISDVRSWASRTETELLDPKSISGSNTPLVELHRMLHTQLAPRGLLDFIKVDFSIVRGLAYYTGVVFEVFDRGEKLRAIAGGGRYDDLIDQLSDGAVRMPALGFAMGDVVLGELIRDRAVTREKMEAAVRPDQKMDVYAVIAKEERRADALAQIQALRDQGFRVDYPLTPAKVGKQFQTAEQLGARLAILFGDEWPEVKVKTLATGEQISIPYQELISKLDSF